MLNSRHSAPHRCLRTSIRNCDNSVHKVRVVHRQPGEVVNSAHAASLWKASARTWSYICPRNTWWGHSRSLSGTRSAATGRWTSGTVDPWRTPYRHRHEDLYIHSPIQGEHKKSSPPTTFVDISAVREDFCMKFYTTVKQSNIHFVTKFGWNLLTKCIFDCFTVVWNFMQKSSRIAEISTKVVGGYFFSVHPVYMYLWCDYCWNVLTVAYCETCLMCYISFDCH